MTSAPIFSSIDLAKRAPKPFLIEPGADARSELAAKLGINAIKKLRFEGKLLPAGKGDWRLEGKLGATVVQPCVVTLEPVTSRVSEDILRLYLEKWNEPDPGSEVEIPEGESEPLADKIDLSEIMEEALSLALPTYPRADGAELGEAIFSAPGLKPMNDDDAKPFAALGELKKSLEE